MAAVEDTQPPPAADETDYDGVPLPLKVPAVGLQCRTLGKREAFEAGGGDENERPSNLGYEL